MPLADAYNRQLDPTITTVYRPIEQFLSQQDEHKVAQATETLSHLDAYLIHQFIRLQPNKVVLVDLAWTDAVWTTTILGILHPHVEEVVVGYRGGENGSVPRDWEDVQDFLFGLESGSSTKVSHLRFPASSGADQVAKESDGLPANAVFLVPNFKQCNHETVSWIEQIIQKRRDCSVMVLGLGRPGVCECVEALMSKFGTRSSGRLFLFREAAEAFYSSQLGVVAARNDSAVEDIFWRMGQQFQGNFRYLDLLKEVCQQAIANTGLDEKLQQEHHMGWVAQYRAQLDNTAGEINTLNKQVEQERTFKENLGRQLSEARDWVNHLTRQAIEYHRQVQWEKKTREDIGRQLVETREECQRLHTALHNCQSSLAVRLGKKIQKWLDRLAPTRTPQRWFLRKSRAAVRHWRMGGIRQVVRRILRRNAHTEKTQIAC